jgi:integrase
MGHVRKRGPNQYQARWMDDSGREHVKVFKKLADAREHVTLMDAAVLHGNSINWANKTTVEQAAREWAEARTGSHGSGTQKRYASVIKQHIAGSSLGAKRLVKVKTTEVQQWVNERAQRLSPSTVRLVVQVLRAVFNAALLDRQIPFSPAAKLSLPKVPDRNIIPLTVPQVIALADAVPVHAEAMVTVHAGLGLRLGELLALRVQDVNFDFHAVRIEGQLTQDGKQRVDTKNQVHRTVPMPEVVAETIREHMVQFTMSEDGLIFTVNGKPWRQDQYDRVLRKAVQEAGLPAGTTSHALRHHYVSVLLHAGLSVHEVAERIGDTAEMVIRVYGHVMPDSEDRTRHAIDAAWQAPRSNDGQRSRLRLAIPSR